LAGRWLSLPDLLSMISTLCAVEDAPGLAAFFGESQGFVQVGEFVRQNGGALSQFVLPLVTRGYLRKKRGTGTGGFQSRYFMLEFGREPQLRYYTGQMQMPTGQFRPNGGVSIILADICSVFVQPPSKRGGKAIKLIGQSRTWTLLATSRPEAIGWSAAIQLAQVPAFRGSFVKQVTTATHELTSQIALLKGKGKELERKVTALRQLLRHDDAMVLSL
jgi:hypothetical protein